MIPYPRRQVREALALLGIRRLLVGVHDAAFPGTPEEDVGRGTPYGDGAAAFLELVAGLGFDGVQLGPQGALSPDDPSPYNGTSFSRNPVSAALAPLARAEWAELLAPQALAEAVSRDPATVARADHARAHRAVHRALDLAFGSFQRRWADASAGSELARLVAELEAFRVAQAEWLGRDARHVADAGTPDRFTFVQFVVHAQHAALRRRAAALGLVVFGDLPPAWLSHGRAAQSHQSRWPAVALPGPRPTRLSGGRDGPGRPGAAVLQGPPAQGVRRVRRAPDRPSARPRRSLGVPRGRRARASRARGSAAVLLARPRRSRRALRPCHRPTRAAPAGAAAPCRWVGGRARRRAGGAVRRAVRRPHGGCGGGGPRRRSGLRDPQHAAVSAGARPRAARPRPLPRHPEGGPGTRRRRLPERERAPGGLGHARQPRHAPHPAAGGGLGRERRLAGPRRAPGDAPAPPGGAARPLRRAGGHGRPAARAGGRRRALRRPGAAGHDLLHRSPRRARALQRPGDGERLELVAPPPARCRRRVRTPPRRAPRHRPPPGARPRPPLPRPSLLGTAPRAHPRPRARRMTWRGRDRVRNILGRGDGMTTSARPEGARLLGAERPSRVVVEGVSPEVDHGRFPAKRTVGEKVVVEADVY